MELRSEIIKTSVIYYFDMGEAKRRKQLDSKYGRVPSLASSSQKQKHVDRLISQLSEKFGQEIREIAAAESIIAPYDRYRQEMFDWLNGQLAHYQADDHTLIASSIMTYYAEIAMRYESSPLLIKFFYDVLQSWLSPDKRQRLEVIANKIAAELKNPS